VASSAVLSPSNSSAINASPSASASNRPPGVYHSINEFTVPNNSRAARSGSMSARRSGRRGRSDQLGDPTIELASAGDSGAFHVGVPAYPQQQGHVRQFLRQHPHGAAQYLLQADHRGPESAPSNTANRVSNARSKERRSNSSLPLTWW